MKVGPPADQAGQVGPPAHQAGQVGQGGQGGQDREDGQAEESALDRALRELLVGEAKVRIDPATGQVVAPGGEKSSLTDSPDPPTIGKPL